MEIPHSQLPHGNQRVILNGNTTHPAKALILMHGRGATAADIIGVAEYLTVPDSVIILAPQAEANTWYPERFIVPQADNQPYLDAAIDRIDTLMTFLKENFLLETTQIALAGFSQGACLVAEYLKRRPQQYLAAAICSGGLIGTDDEVKSMVEGSLQRTPVYLGCDEEDFHIPNERVSATARYLEAHQADVTLRLYRNFGHTIHPDAFVFLNQVLQ